MSLTANPAFNQITVRDLANAATVGARDPESGEILATAPVGENGTAIIRSLASGPVELVTLEGDAAIATAGIVELPDRTPPPQSFYDNRSLQPGFSYIETRDGTLLSAQVTLPSGATTADGPFPTLVEYSGYEPSNPGAEDPTRLIIPLLGYALVQVNVRGTGCSGGSYDGFAEIERLDGYDVIETVAAQAWSSGIGMWGVSYPGIMQLHVASTQPPSLDAIAPLSVIGSIDEVLFPGGIFNNGFGQTWTARVTGNAQAGGQPWTEQRVAAGDSTCEANQDLRVHNPDLVKAALASPVSTEVTRERSPESFVDQIEVPTFIAGAFQDEQTGGGFPVLLDHFTAAPALRATLYNGLHIDPLGPDVLVPLLEFYDIYVAKRAPVNNSFVSLIVSAGAASFFGQPLPLTESPLAGLSYPEALSIYESADPIRVLYEVGTDAPNLPLARFEETFTSWPPPELTPKRLPLGSEPPSTLGDATTAGLAEELAVDGTLGGRAEGPIFFLTDPAEGAVRTAPDTGVIWGSDPNWQWPLAANSGAARYATDPLSETLVLTGTASVDLRVSLPSGEPDADIEATLSILSATGDETYVQSGWLRLSRRALEDGDGLNPRISNRETDIDPLEPGEEVDARIATLPFAAVVRPGERLVLTLDTPGASRAEWAFAVLPEPVQVAIMPGSSLLLPVLPLAALDTAPPTNSPACGSLRAQPCRSGPQGK